MSESTPPVDPKPPRKELSMEQRLLLAFGLMGLVLFVTPYVLPKPKQQPPPAKKAESPQAPAPASAPAPPAEAAPPARITPEKPAAQAPVAASKEETYIVDTDLYRVVFSNRGAVVRSWVLKKYLDSKGAPVDLVNASAFEKTGRPFSVRMKNGKLPVDLNQSLFAADFSPDKLSIDFQFSGSGVQAKKSFRFRRDGYISHLTSEVTLNGQAKPHFLVWRGGFGDMKVSSPSSLQHTTHYDLAANKLIVRSASDADDGPLAERGSFSFAGLEDAYFAAVLVPPPGADFEIQTLMDSLHCESEGKERPHAGAALGGVERIEGEMFVGPKDLDMLRRVAPKLEQLVDFGWFSMIAKPLFLALNWMNDRYFRNYGWTIVVVTIIINFLLLPLKYTSLKSMQKMKMLQPEIAALNAKYKGLSIRDPKKQQQNQEMMDLYKKHGVNPLGGCMPMILQIPFFIAFYKVLTVAIELRGAHWLWVTDLSQPEHLPIRILPLAMVGSQFVMQKLTPSASPDPSQQRIMMLMPLFLGFMFYGVSSGLVLYWLTSNLVGIAQQMAFNRFFHSPAAAVVPTTTKKQAKR